MMCTRVCDILKISYHCIMGTCTVFYPALLQRKGKEICPNKKHGRFHLGCCSSSSSSSVGSRFFFNNFDWRRGLLRSRRTYSNMKKCLFLRWQSKMLWHKFSGKIHKLSSCFKRRWRPAYSSPCTTIVTHVPSSAYVYEVVRGQL